MSRASREQLRAIDALVGVGLRLARSAPSGRILLARIAAAIELEWIPRPEGDEIVEALEQARDRTPEPLDERRLQRLLTAAWGTRAREELDHLDPDPVALTATAQVNRGVLDGHPVAIKVLRPGIEASVRQDLALLEGMLVPLAAAFPALDAPAVLREFRERALDELDLEHEAETQRRFHRRLRTSRELLVPAPVMRLSQPQVIVSEWVQGVPLRSAADPDEAAVRLLRFGLGAVREGVVHAGLTPEDVLIVPDGRVAILDFGASATVEQSRVDAIATVVEAFAAGDGEVLGHALERLGVLPASAGPQALALARHVLSELAAGRPARLDSAAIVAARERLDERLDDLTVLLAAGRLPPADLWPARAAAQLFATIARAGGRADWLGLVLEALRDGWR